MKHSVRQKSQKNARPKKRKIIVKHNYSQIKYLKDYFAIQQAM
jgi:hypothetical protein